MAANRWTRVGGRNRFVGGLAGGLVLAVGLAAAGPLAGEEPAADPALARARGEVKMLDTLYKTAVVAATERYTSGPPAIHLAKDVFAAMEKGEYHSARLVGTGDSLFNEANKPATDFEKRAAEAMRKGQTYFEEVVGTGDERRLLAATVVPAVHKRCAECHGIEEGALMGFIRYDLPVR